jgi:Ca-activated chloride channel family protein
MRSAFVLIAGVLILHAPSELTLVAQTSAAVQQRDPASDSPAPPSTQERETSSDRPTSATTPTQEPAPAVFKAQSDLVVLQVNVFDNRSDAVPDLPQSAFTVLEDDRPQEITFFSSGDVPVAVGLVVDNSGSMIARRAMVLAGGTAFAESSHPEDELFTVIFNEHVRYGLPDGVDFTRSRQQLTSALARFPPSGKTALYDAVIEALGHLETASHQKRVLVVLSDGADNASRHTREEMFTRAALSDAIVYTVAKRDADLGSDGDPAVLKRLADVSGGVAYRPRTEAEVVQSFEEIAGNIRRGYAIGYVPAADGGSGYRRVKVMVRVPGRTNLTARARHGYTPRRPDGTL